MIATKTHSSTRIPLLKNYYAHYHRSCLNKPMLKMLKNEFHYVLIIYQIKVITISDISTGVDMFHYFATV